MKRKWILKAMGIVFSASLFAAGGVTGGNFEKMEKNVIYADTLEFEISEDGKELIAYHGNAKSVVIPEGIEVIGEKAFQNNDTITEVKFPSTLKKIDGYAFDDCDSLTTAVLPEGLERIGASAFADCRALTSSYIPSTVTRIGNDAFYYCCKIKEITLPEGLTYLGSWAFLHCDDMEKITFPSTLAFIPWQACSYCASLKEVYIPEGVESIDGDAFSYTALTSIVIPSTVTTMYVTKKPEDAIFAGLSEDFVLIGTEGSEAEAYAKEMGLSFKPVFEITNGKLVKYNGNGKVVTIPDGVTIIGISAFYHNTSLEKVIIPDSVKTIQTKAFMQCFKLTSVSFPAKMTSIDSYAFSTCISLKKIVLPSGLTRINPSCFANCSNLEEVQIGYGVKTIFQSSFQSCGKLKKVVIPSTVTAIADSAFPNLIAKISYYGYLGTYAEEFVKTTDDLFVDALPFTDIDRSNWQYTVAAFVYQKHIVNGTSATTFSPISNMTRGQFVVMLWRMAGSIKTEYRNSFADVSSSSFCAEALQWCKDHGLASGYADSTFRPNDKITREQFIVFIYRYAKYMGYDTSVESENSYKKIADYAGVSSYAVPMMNWAYERGFIAADGKFNAKNNITRIQASAILMRFMQYYE